MSIFDIFRRRSKERPSTSIQGHPLHVDRPKTVDTEENRRRNSMRAARLEQAITDWADRLRNGTVDPEVAEAKLNGLREELQYRLNWAEKHSS